MHYSIFRPVASSASDIDALSTLETGGPCLPAFQARPTRYAVRQVLSQELQRVFALREAAARQARYAAGHATSSSLSASSAALAVGKPAKAKGAVGIGARACGSTVVKKDFFGRVIETPSLAQGGNAGSGKRSMRHRSRVWVTFHEGLNNAVTKPISLDEFMQVL